MSLRRVSFVDRYTLRFPSALEKYQGEWVPDFDKSDDATLVSAGYDKLFDPEANMPEMSLDGWRPTYKEDENDPEVIVYGEWEHFQREPSLPEKIMLKDLKNGSWETYGAEVLYQHADIIPEWSQESIYARGTIVRDAGKLWASLHDMITFAQNTKPSTTPSMWIEVSEAADGWGDWVQPIGTIGLYGKGAQVTHNGQRWVSKIDYNGHEPSTAAFAAWTLVKDEDAANPVEFSAWVQPLGTIGLYSIGDKVTHNGQYWVSIIDFNGHEPSAAAFAAWTITDPPAQPEEEEEVNPELPEPVIPDPEEDDNDDPVIPDPGEDEGPEPVPAVEDEDPPNYKGEWKQPTGSHDSYKKDDVVTYNNQLWISTVNGNSWAPGIAGWIAYTG